MPSRARRPATRSRPLDRDLLTDDELRRLVFAADARYDGGARARALLYMLAHGGLRCAEAVAVRPKDVSPDGAVVVQHGKGGRRRVVQLSGQGMAALAVWLERRKAWPNVGPRSPVFCTRTGGPLPASYVRKLVARLGARAVPAKRCHPHALRHHCALELVRRGCSLVEVQQQLGHAHASTTSAYLTRLDPQRNRLAVRRAWDGE